MNRALVLLVLCTLSTAASAQTPTALREFTDAASVAYDRCRAYAPVSGSAQRDCVAKDEAPVRSKFESAEKAVAKNKAMVGMTRDFYAFWLATFKDVLPRGDEPRTMYERRTGDAQTQINERAIRLNLELAR